MHQKGTFFDDGSFIEYEYSMFIEYEHLLFKLKWNGILFSGHLQGWTKSGHFQMMVGWIIWIFNVYWIFTSVAYMLMNPYYVFRSSAGMHQEWTFSGDGRIYSKVWLIKILFLFKLISVCREQRKSQTLISKKCLCLSKCGTLHLYCVIQILCFVLQFQVEGFTYCNVLLLKSDPWMCGQHHWPL